MNRIVILMYHVIDRARSRREAKYCCPPDRFEQQMSFLRESGANLLTLDQIAMAIEGETTTPTSGVAITFDDGFRDTFRHALPTLVRYKIPATMFVLAKRLGAQNDWMVPRGFPARDLMSRSEVLDMQNAGVCIGSHTCTHPRLPHLDPRHSAEEIRASRECLQALTGASVDHFAYPFGLYDDNAVRAVAAAGYRTACSTRGGFNGEGTDPYALRRLEIFGSDTLWHFRQKLKFGANDITYFYPIRYYSSRLVARLTRQ